jgi:hypothetical protein
VGAKSPIFTLVIQVDETDSSSRIFQPNKVALFHFLMLPITTEAMGTGGLRAYSLSHSDKVNAGAKTAKCTSASQ